MYFDQISVTVWKYWFANFLDLLDLVSGWIRGQINHAGGANYKKVKKEKEEEKGKKEREKGKKEREKRKEKKREENNI